jgi:hypothetical protein
MLAYLPAELPKDAAAKIRAIANIDRSGAPFLSCS